MARARKRASKKKGPRTRRTADEARRLILDAAERQLAEVGPAGLRLQEVAKEVGVSHPTVLHHFGSREELVEYCLRRCRGWMIAGGSIEMMKNRIAEGVFGRSFAQRP